VYRIFVLMLLFSNTTFAIADEELEILLLQIEQLISANDLAGAKAKLAEADTANLKDESLEVIQSQLRLLESLNTADQESGNSASTGTITEATPVASQGAANQTSPARVAGQPLTASDQLAAVDLLDSLRIAVESGEIAKVRQLSTTREEIDSLLNAVFNNYSSVKIEVSEPIPNYDNQSFDATLEFVELQTKEGNVAFPAQAWKTHNLRIVETDGNWNKVLW